MSRYFRAIQGIQTAIASGAWPSARSLEIALNSSPLDGAPSDSSRPWQITLNPADLILKALNGEPSSDNLIPTNSILSFMKIDLLAAAALLELATPKCAICDSLTVRASKSSAIEAIKTKSEGTLIVALRPTDPNFISLPIDQAMQFAGGASLIIDGLRVKGSALQDILGNEVSNYPSLRILLKTFALPLSAADEAELAGNLGDIVKVFGQIEFSIMSDINKTLSFESLNPEFCCPNKHSDFLKDSKATKYVRSKSGRIALDSRDLKFLKLSELESIFAGYKAQLGNSNIVLDSSLNALIESGFGDYSLDCRLADLSMGEILKLVIARTLLLGSRDFSIDITEVVDFLERLEASDLVKKLKAVGIEVLSKKELQSEEAGKFRVAESVESVFKVGPYECGRYQFPEFSIMVGQVNILQGPSGTGKELLGFSLVSDRLVNEQFSKTFKCSPFKSVNGDSFYELLGLGNLISKIYASTAAARMVKNESDYCQTCLYRILRDGWDSSWVESSCSRCSGHILIGPAGLIEFGGFTLGKLLCSTVAQAMPLLGGIRQIAPLISLAHKLGLSEIKLGTHIEDLTQEEMRLVNLASELKNATGSSKASLIFLEHPFVGLSDNSRAKLKAFLQELCKAGHTAILIDNSGSFYEHSPNVIPFVLESVVAGKFLIKVKR
jgi:ABC-type Mn2+/Zn2+ transport system ATPase subunit